MILIIVSAFSFTACKDPVDPPIEGLTAEQQVQKIKDINQGAYNAYFGEQEVNAFTVAPIMTTYSEEEYQKPTKWFENWFMASSITTNTIVNNKQTEVLTKSFSITTETNLASQYPTELEEGVLQMLEQVAEGLAEFTLYGTIDNTLYLNIVAKTGTVINAAITYVDDNDYTLTLIFPRGTDVLDSGKRVESFDKKTSSFIKIAFGNNDDWFEDTSHNPAIDHAGAKVKVDQYITEFNNAVATFPEKEETVDLIF